MLTLKGTPEKPIVIRGAGDGEAIFDGDGSFRLFDVMAADYHIFEGLTIRNTDVAFWAGLKDVLGPKGLTVRNCRIENVGIGINAQYAGSKDFYIADNVFLGRDDPHRVLGWASPDIYGAHDLRSYYAVKVYGSGHVICHNAVAFFHDGIDVSTHGTPETEQESKAVAIDIYNNDIHVTGDDFIESDGGVHNIRVMRNRGINAAHTALSAQPVFGGPVYFIRNVVYNAPTALKFMAKPAGYSAVSQHDHFGEPEYADLLQRAIPQQPVPGHGRAGSSHLGVSERHVVLDVRLRWLPPESRCGAINTSGSRPSRANCATTKSARAMRKRFKTLAELAAATGAGNARRRTGLRHLRERASARSQRRPTPCITSPSFDFRLKPGSKAVDAGVRLPNVNDDFGGQAPDLGAYETGKPLPVYGPRTAPAQPFYQ